MEGREGKGVEVSEETLLEGELWGSPASGKGNSSSGMCSREDGLAEDLGTDEPAHACTCTVHVYDSMYVCIYHWSGSPLVPAVAEGGAVGGGAGD